MLQSPWKISLLGGFEIRQRSLRGSPATTNQMSELLAMLAERVGRQVQRTELIEEIWPNEEDELARNRFRVLLAAVRKLLEPPGTPTGTVLISDRTSVTLGADACIVDVDEFQRHIQKAHRTTSTDVRMDHYKSADELYGGEFMSGRPGQWVAGRRSHYARLQGLAQYRYAALLEESGDLPAAMHQINRSIEADPLREAPRRRALRMLAESGDLASALVQYEEFRLLLKRSLGLAPTAEFQDWIKSLRSGGVPQRSFDSGRSDTSRLESPAPAQVSESKRIFLPPSLTSFLGRTTEIVELGDLLHLYRWLTVVGAGGVGKTRLAVETARANVSQFGAGVIYVPVSDAPGSSALLEVILQQIQVEPSADPLDTLRRYLSQPIDGGRNACLFVFDGIDQLANDSIQVIMRLLSDLPNATILATARRGRGVNGEHEYPLRPLEIPDLDISRERVLTNPTFQLFMERAKSASPRFDLPRGSLNEVVALCRRLEGVPLAIELAAAQVGSSPPASILQKLGDIRSLNDPKAWREPRHRSLQASLAFSLDSLEPREQNLFCSLCVFRGTFDAVAAGLVAGAEPDDLARLVDHSLLTLASDTEVRRYSMLDMVREFGWAKLSLAEKNRAQDRHATYFRRLVLDYATLHMNGGIHHLPKLRLELENIRVAAEWTLKNRDAESAARLSFDMTSLWIYSGFQQWGRDYVNLVRDTLRLTELQAAILDATEGILACFQDDPETGRERIARALPVFERGGMRKESAGARWSLGFAAYLRGDFEECLTYARQMESSDTTQPSRWFAYQQNMIGFASIELDRLDEAEELIRQSQRLWLDLGDSVYADFCNLNLARITWKRGDLELAWDQYRDTAGTLGEWNDRRGLAYAVEGLGRVSCDLENYAQAVQLLGAAQRLRESIGLRRDFADERVFASAVKVACEALGPSYDVEWQAGYSIAPTRVPQWVEHLTR